MTARLQRLGGRHLVVAAILAAAACHAAQVGGDVSEHGCRVGEPRDSQPLAGGARPVGHKVAHADQLHLVVCRIDIAVQIADRPHADHRYS